MELFLADGSESLLEKLVLFSMMWSLGAVLESKDRLQLQELFLNQPDKLAWPKNMVYTFYLSSIIQSDIIYLVYCRVLGI
jgi:hypothetical protein